MSSSNRSNARTLGPVVAMVLVSLFSLDSRVSAAPQCFNQSCSATCTPDGPVEISPLIEPADFPAGADTPVAFVDPGDQRGRWLVATQQGAILLWDGHSDTILDTFFLDLRENVGGPVLAGGERGLLALAVDPDYATSGLFYVFYTRRDLGPGTQGDIVIERYRRSAANPNVADPATAETILVLEHSAAANHNGGWLAFGPDGFLYVSTGDGGSFCDSNQGTSGDGQRSDTLAGKLLRLDVHGVDPQSGPPDNCGVGVGNYTVPSDNPFFGQEPACDEVWGMGLRNPFRFSFDRLTGDLYIGDVGQRKWEEINLQAKATPAPVNWGWVCREGCESAGNDESTCSTAGCPVDPGTSCEFPRTASGYWDPVLCHYNGGWTSIMGGYRYRGTQVPSIAGDYIYGDASCGQIWKTTTLDPTNPVAIDAACWASGFGGTYGFSEDTQGELYVVRGGGQIDCIHNGEGCFWAGAAGPLHDDDFELGNTSAWSATTP